MQCTSNVLRAGVPYFIYNYSQTHPVENLARYLLHNYRQFWEVARERYLKNDRHKQTQNNIADYFSGELHIKYGEDRDIPAQPHAYSSVALNLRKLDRLPVALLEAGDFKRLRSTLGDLKFVQAKCMAGMGYQLLAVATHAVRYSSDQEVDDEVGSCHRGCDAVFEAKYLTRQFSGE